MAKMKKRPSHKHTMVIAPLDTAVLSYGDLYISEWLERMGKKPVDVARDADVSEGYLSAIASGKHKANPTLDALRKIGRAIGVPVWALFLPPPEYGLHDHVMRFLSDLAKRQ